MGPDDQRRAAEQQANRDRLYWEAQRQEEVRERARQLADDKRFRDEALKRERLVRERKVNAERIARDEAHRDRVGEERAKRAEAHRNSVIEAAKPKVEAPVRPVPLDAVGRMKEAAAQRLALATRGPMKLPNGVRASRLIQGLGPMDRKK